MYLCTFYLVILKATLRTNDIFASLTPPAKIMFHVGKRNIIQIPSSQLVPSIEITIMSKDENNDAKEDAADDDIVVDRSCISCDKCGVGSPQKCCARCKSYYYCR